MTEVAGFVTGAESFEGRRPSVETPSGRFYMDAPVLNLEACAHSLAQMNRYNGHGRFPVSVATHAVLVSLLMEEVTGGDPFEGLHHDDDEYVLTDVASPWKPLLPDWKALSKATETAFRNQLGLPPKTKECAVADWLALFIEANQLMPSKGEGWEDPEGIRPWALKLVGQGWRVTEIDWRRSRDIFVQRHNAIRPVSIPAIEF